MGGQFFFAEKIMKDRGGSIGPWGDQGGQQG